MHHVLLPDSLYKTAERRANDAGFESVDAYVADVLESDLDEPGNLEFALSTDRLEAVDKAAAAVAAGEFLDDDQVGEHFENKRVGWHQGNHRES